MSGRTEDLERPASPSWDGLLDAVATGGQRLVLESRSGRRVVLIAESELAQLESEGSARPAREVGLLSEREREVLALIGQGLSGIETAGRLGLATNTVAQHLTSVRRKLGVRSSAAAVEVARSSGLLEA